MNKIQGIVSDFAYFKEEGGRYVIGYGLTKLTKSLYEWNEVYIYKRQHGIVSLDDAKQAILDDINARTDEKILSGFTWNEKPVWLSMESQFNYKASYDKAVQTKGATLPVTFKLGEQDGTPVYHTFESLEEFTDFSDKTIAYVQACLEAGWSEKDGIDWSPYEALFPAAAVTQEQSNSSSE